jgi:hypothetical protein
MNWSHQAQENTGRGAWPLACLLCLALSACQAQPASQEAPAVPAPQAPREVSQRVTLALLAQEQSPQAATVTLRYAREEGVPGPRAVEAFVYHSEHLELLRSEPGQAATAADKQVIVQPQGEGKLRVIVYASTNLHELDSGELVRLRFARVGQGEAVVDFLSDEVNLAPAQAARGMTLSEPLILGGR